MNFTFPHLILGQQLVKLPDGRMQLVTTKSVPVAGNTATGSQQQGGALKSIQPSKPATQPTQKMMRVRTPSGNVVLKPIPTQQPAGVTGSNPVVIDGTNAAQQQQQSQVLPFGELILLRKKVREEIRNLAVQNQKYLDQCFYVLYAYETCQNAIKGHTTTLYSKTMHLQNFIRENYLP